MRRAIFLLLAIFSFYLTAADFSVPFLKAAPTIDGRFSKGEWDCAMAFSGGAKNMDARRTTVWMAYDKSNIYMALQAETPPRGNLVAASRWMNHHDSMELWFAPPEKLRTVESLKFGVFQFMVNFEEKTMAEHHNPGYGLSSRPWKHNAIVKSKVEGGLWTMEMAFPLKEMGVESSPEGDWRIMVCRNYGVAPRREAPMTDVSSYSDPNSYSVFHFAKDALATQQLYSGEARLPLRFRVANNGSKPASTEIALALSGDKQQSLSKKLDIAPGKAVEQDFTEECAAEGGKCKIDFKAKGWNRSITWQPPKLPLWQNTESYQTLFCGFDADKNEIIEYTTIKDAKAKVSKPELGKPSAVQGPTASRKVLDFTGRTVSFPNARLSTSGAVSFWMRVAAPLPKEKSFRRFFGTSYRPNGYIYFQEQRDGGFLVGCQSFAPENKNPKNTLIGRRPQPGQWMHIAINFLPEAVEVYMNGIRRGNLSHKFPMDFSKVGEPELSNAAYADFSVYSRPLSVAEITMLSQGDKPVTGNVCWYQSLNKAVLDLVLDCKAVPEKKLQLQIRNSKDKVVETFALDFSKAYSKEENGREMATLRLALPVTRKLADGKYSFFLSKTNSETPLLERSFEVKDYAWLNNDIGKADRLITGFTPLKRNGSKLSAVLKEMTLGKNGLPEAITANGGAVLARPVEVIAEANGKRLAWKCQAPRFLSESDTTITAENALECEALKIQANIRMEQDGLLRYDWKLTSGAKPLPTRLYVDIPIRKEIATLYHPVGEGLRHNPAGFVPKGNGLLFSSKKVPQTHFDSFLPYIWVGNEYRGLCYAADWDKGWCHSKERDGVELFREKDGTVTIRLNLLNSPMKLAKDNTITFALLASPVKPMPKGWRGWRDAFTKKGTQLSRAMYSNFYWGCFYTWTGRYPAFQDFSHWDKMFEAQRTGVIDKEYINAWTDRIMKAYGTSEAPWLNNMTKENARSHILSHTQGGFNITAGLHDRQDDSIVYCYTCDSDSTAKLPEHPVMRDEWVGGLMLNESYVDYAIYYLDKMLEHGFKGIYNDNVFLSAGNSWATGGAWIDDNGRVHPSLGLWRCREYNRRQAVTMMDRGIKPWICAHHTNTNILPTIGLTTNTMGMEWKYGVNDFQERFTSDYIRAVCSGVQAGCFPTVLEGITGAKTKEIKDWATRTMLASLLPHEVQPTCPRGANYTLIKNTLDRFYDFGTWKDDCVVYNFWDEKAPVKCSNDALKQVTYQRGKDIFTFIGSYADNDCTAEMTYAKPIASAKNEETGKSLNVAGNKVIFTLKKHDFIIIRATE